MPACAPTLPGSSCLPAYTAHAPYRQPCARAPLCHGTFSMRAHAPLAWWRRAARVRAPLRATFLRHARFLTQPRRLPAVCRFCVAHSWCHTCSPAPRLRIYMPPFAPVRATTPPPTPACLSTFFFLWVLPRFALPPLRFTTLRLPGTLFCNSHAAGPATASRTRCCARAT